MSVLAPGLSALTLAPAVSWDGQRHFGAYATPGRHGVGDLDRHAQRAGRVAQRHGVALAQAASGGLLRMHGDRRLADAVAQLAVVAERRVHQPGRGGREQPQLPVRGRLVEARLGQARVPVGLGARRGDLDAPARRREALGELHARLGVEAHGAGARERLPAHARGREQVLDQLRVALVQRRRRRSPSRPPGGGRSRRCAAPGRADRRPSPGPRACGGSTTAGCRRTRGSPPRAARSRRTPRCR